METVLVQEALQEKKIAEIAATIASNPKIKFVLDRRTVLFGKDNIFPQIIHSASSQRSGAASYRRG